MSFTIHRFSNENVVYYLTNQWIAKQKKKEKKKKFSPRDLVQRGELKSKYYPEI